MSLFIGNLSTKTTKEDLEREFGGFGKCYIKFKGAFAFAEYNYEEDAEKAKDALQGKLLNDKEMNVEWSKTSTKYNSSHHRKRSHSNSFKGKCYICGHHGHYARFCPKGKRDSRESRSRSSYHRRSYRKRRSSDYSRNKRRRYSSDASNSRSRSRSDSYRRRRHRRSYSKSRSRSRRKSRSRSRSRSYSRNGSFDSRKNGSIPEKDAYKEDKKSDEKYNRSYSKNEEKKD